MKKDSLLIYKIVVAILLLVIVVFGSIIAFMYSSFVINKQGQSVSVAVVEPVQITIEPTGVHLYDRISEPSDREILRLMFGEDAGYRINPENQVLEAIWHPGEDNYKEKAIIDRSAPLYSRVIEKIRIYDDTKIIYQIYFGTAEVNSSSTCAHSNAIFLGGAIISNSGDGWVIEHFNNNVSFAGSFCLLPDHEVVLIGPNKPAVVFHDYYAQSGVRIYTDRVLFEMGGEIINGLDVPVHYDAIDFCSTPLGSDNECEYKTIMYKFVPGDNPDIYDLKVKENFVSFYRQSGVMSFPGREYLMKFIDGTYQQIEEMSW